MKKVMFIVFLFVLVGTNSFAFKSSRTEVVVSGFDGHKPLLKDEVMPVSFPENYEDIWLIEAYKGETKTSFIKRITNVVDSVDKSHGSVAGFDTASTEDDNQAQAEAQFARNELVKEYNDVVLKKVFSLIAILLIAAFSLLKLSFYLEDKYNLKKAKTLKI